MKKNCIQCSAPFEITKDDLAFYEKVSPEFGGKKYAIPPPTLCPQCRMQRRLAFRNEQTLFHRQCAKTGKSIISMYAPEQSFPVFDNEEWWKDDWDAKEHGVDFDFGRSYLEQFIELWNKVPKMARIQQGENANARYTNCASYNKNCFMVFSANENEDCLYGNYVNKSRSCIDSFGLFKCELCLECVNCDGCYFCSYLQNCVNCSDSSFLKDCVSCKHCFGCINLREKEYHIFNEPHSRKEYEEKMHSLKLDSAKMLHDIEKTVQDFFMQFPHRSYQGIHNENVSGNYILHSKNARECYDVEYIEDCAHCAGLQYARDAYDISHYGCTTNNELLYECEGVGHGVVGVLFSKLIWGGSSDILCSYECFASHNLFGCAGLKHATYCVFNKQYSKEEYEALVPKIIDYMKKTGEWGEFFPVSMSPFGFNETLGQEYWPVTREDAEARGWKWRAEERQTKYLGPDPTLPDDVHDATQAICDQILHCEVSGQLYKIVPQELSLRQQMGIALPRLCYRERHNLRLVKRNPRKLWNRACAKCKKNIETTYAPDRPEIVYCEECYLSTVY